MMFSLIKRQDSYSYGIRKRAAGFWLPAALSVKPEKVKARADLSSHNKSNKSGLVDNDPFFSLACLYLKHFNNKRHITNYVWPNLL
jgi:hypothetical protein